MAGERKVTMAEATNVLSKDDVIQALKACARRDCAHCLYQGKGIQCARRLMADAATLLSTERGPREK